MAELDVQPKKKSPWWIWLIVAAIVIALFFWIRTRDHAEGDRVATEGAATLGDFDNVDFNATETAYGEVTDSSITVRGNADYAIYGLGNNILFSVGDTALQASAEYQLKQIGASINQRYKGAPIAVYGSTDSTGSAGSNEQLGELRAEAVKQWLVQHAAIPSDQISVHSKGQSSPVADNATPEGRQMNRRVDIVVKLPK